jgi:hypothetical protein
VLGLGAAVVAAAALRFPFLGNQSLWYDETYTRAIVNAGSLGDVWRGVEATEATPPLYYLLTWAWGKPFGVASDAGLRMFGALAQVAAVPVAFAALRSYVGRGAALASAWLVATSPLLVFYALDARAYSLLVLLSLASLWALARLLERPAARRWLAWALIAAACVWTHYFAGFLVLAEVVVLAWRLPPARRALAAWSVVVAALCAPLVPLLTRQADSRSDAIGSSPLRTRVEGAARELATGPNVPRAWLEAVGIALAAGGLAVGLAALRRRGHAARPIAAIAAIGLALPLLLSVTEVADRFLIRNVLIVWGCVAALAAVGLVRARALPLVTYVLLSIAAVLWIQGDWRYRNPDWAAATAELRDRARAARNSEVTVAVYPRFNAPLARRYLSPSQPRLRPFATADFWVLLEPVRLGARELEPRPGLPRLPAGFAVTASYSVRGFRLLQLHAPRAATIGPDSFGTDSVGDPPALRVVELE